LLSSPFWPWLRPNNVVIDVRVTDYAVSDRAVRVINAIVGRNPL
jgi:hypothetical protein